MQASLETCRIIIVFNVNRILLDLAYEILNKVSSEWNGQKQIKVYMEIKYIDLKDSLLF